MAYIAVAAGLLVFALLILQHRERAAHQAQIALLWRKTEAERAALLERIQHPERAPVTPGEPVVYEPPDSPEMARVGQILYEDEETS